MLALMKYILKCFEITCKNKLTTSIIISKNNLPNANWYPICYSLVRVKMSLASYMFYYNKFSGGGSLGQVTSVVCDRNVRDILKIHKFINILEKIKN